MPSRASGHEQKSTEGGWFDGGRTPVPRWRGKVEGCPGLTPLWSPAVPTWLSSALRPTPASTTTYSFRSVSIRLSPCGSPLSYERNCTRSLWVLSWDPRVHTSGSLGAHSSGEAGLEFILRSLDSKSHDALTPPSPSPCSKHSRSRNLVLCSVSSCRKRWQLSEATGLLRHHLETQGFPSF